MSLKIQIFLYCVHHTLYFLLRQQNSPAATCVPSSSLLVLKSKKLKGDFKVIARTKAFYHILQVSPYFASIINYLLPPYHFNRCTICINRELLRRRRLNRNNEIFDFVPFLYLYATYCTIKYCVKNLKFTLCIQLILPSIMP
jgi:hypothetical protein